MNKYIKAAIIIIITCLFGVAIALISLANKFSHRYSIKYKPAKTMVVVPADSDALIRGRMLSTTLCTNCHGRDFAGTELFKDRWIGTVYAKNITPGGAVKNFTSADWVNAIRFGVRDDGEPLLIMPSSDDYNHMSDYDLGCVIAYMKTVKASDKEYPENIQSITLYGKAVIQSGKFGQGLFSAETISMTDNTPRPSPAFNSTPAYGGYLVTLSDCRFCHGPLLNGGIDTGSGGPRGPNITTGGSLRNWNAGDFIRAFRLGITPTGKHINPEYMPWPYMGVLDDTALTAIFAYIKSQPALGDAKH
jgi:mono/diheme cytochrome c family protein